MPALTILAAVSFEAIGALLAGLGGIISGWLAIRKSHEEGRKTCHEELEVLREESEKYAASLHKIRMEHPELIEGEG